MLIEMHLARILIREHTSAQIIELREMHPLHGEPRSFPIVIGISEAIAIDRRLSGFEVGRPMTHDLLANTIDALNATLESIAITHIVDGTVFATRRHKELQPLKGSEPPLHHQNSLLFPD